MRRAIDLPAQAGFTLVEMIVSIVIAGILVALVGMFGRWQIQSYLDVSSRAGLADAGDTAIRRITRDLQSALPNSVRVDATGNFLEFIPIKDAGRYRAAGGTSDFPLDFGSGATASRFDVLGPGVTIEAGDQIVVYNLGLPGSNAYENGNSRHAPNVTGSGLSQVASATAFAFPFASPANRFQVVGNPVTYECDRVNGVIRRHTGYGFNATQPTGFGSGDPILVDSLSPASGCAFAYTPGALQRNGIVSIKLTLSANGESVSLMNQVEVLNTP